MARLQAPVALTTLLATSSAQAWIELSSSSQPAPVQAHAMAWDAARAAVVLFAGQETWEWSGTNWLQRSTPSGPIARNWAKVAYDASRQRVVLFGGVNPGIVSALADTWEWDGTAWAPRFSAHHPPGRSRHCMCFDAARQRVVLFGGTPGAGGFADTWLWDGVDWTLATPPTSPTPRYSASMAYDAASQQVVLFGGQITGPIPGPGNDTWTWNGNTWTQRIPPTRPGPLDTPVVAYDPLRQRVVLHGASGPINETWEWDGQTWMQMPALAALPRREFAMTFDGVNQGVLLFGGRTTLSVVLNDTWLWRIGTPAAAAAYGSACGSPPLVMQPDANARPVIGTVARTRVVAPPTTLVGVTAGLSDRFFGPFPLPVTLAGLGMPGCFLLQSMDAFGLPTTPQGADVDFAMAIPNTPALVAQRVYLQAYCFAPGTNPIDVIVSNGIDWRIGDV